VSVWKNNFARARAKEYRNELFSRKWKNGKTKAHQKSHLFLGQRRGREAYRDDSREERYFFFVVVVVVVVSSREVEEEEFAGFLLSADVHVRVDFSHVVF
jgi:hypothetical protein